MEDKERNPDIQENSNNQEIKKSNLDENNEESVVSDLLHVLGIKKSLKNKGKNRQRKYMTILQIEMKKKTFREIRRIRRFR